FEESNEPSFQKQDISEVVDDEIVNDDEILDDIMEDKTLEDNVLKNKILDSNNLSDMELDDKQEEKELLEDSLTEDMNIHTKQNNKSQNLQDILSKIFVNAALECYDEMEKAYYLVNFLPVCFNCDSLEYIMPILKDQYLYCELCTANSDIKIKLGKGLKFSSNTTSKK
ncbi:758_t:CDS:1, partial [Racocetra fulgida]